MQPEPRRAPRLRDDDDGRAQLVQLADDDDRASPAPRPARASPLAYRAARAGTTGHAASQCTAAIRVRAGSLTGRKAHRSTTNAGTIRHRLQRGRERPGSCRPKECRGGPGGAWAAAAGACWGSVRRQLSRRVADRAVAPGSARTGRNRRRRSRASTRERGPRAGRRSRGPRPDQSECLPLTSTSCAAAATELLSSHPAKCCHSALRRRRTLDQPRGSPTRRDPRPSLS